uniref:CSN8/PSMD8/EIF3K domain-containing protein n=1 Tax=Plectus sambesii TaxID=2011161 RepID=A0A914V7G8_9BILA
MQEQQVTSPSAPPADPTRPADPPQPQQAQASAEEHQQGGQRQEASQAHMVSEAMQADQQTPRQPTPAVSVTVTSSTIPVRVAQLESAELDGVCSTEMYAQLLACYLAMSSWKQAQLLHWRLPASPRKSDEVKAVWAVGKPLIQRKLSQAYRAYHATAFTEALRPYMEVVVQQSRIAAFDLAARAYCKIKVENLAQLVDLDGEDLKAAIHQRGWTVASNFVAPLMADDQKDKHPSNDGILEVTTLVDYASFLEN